jgi:acyl-CoA synthetase (AMP-forming)/AMP-acid ligase II
MTQADSTAEFLTLVDLLRFRAASQPDRRAYTFLTDGETEEVHLTYDGLERKAQSVTASLRPLITKSDRILLLFPPGLEFITAFFGCLYAGAVAIPAYPPEPGRLRRTLPLLSVIANDAQPAAVLTTSRILGSAEKCFVQAPELQALPWLALDNAQNSAAEQWRDPNLDGQSLALVQYTSGSTSAPRGVMVSHSNLLHNSALIQQSFEHSPNSRGVIWLPPHHDMGLVGGILQPLYGGFPVTLMSPVAFLLRPLRWLQSISRTRATTSGGPNFAYDLCTRKITPEQRAGLDLSSWKVAFNGSEPIRLETIERFSETFKSCGFRREAFYPCYGLAEATLFVSGGTKAGAFTLRTGDNSRAEASPSVSGDGKNDLTGKVVGCGCVPHDQEVIIVDLERRTKMPSGQIGEIWLSGPSMAHGYWNRPEETKESFRAYLADTGEGPFLRTGDLGFLWENEIFITGRLKDLIIISGRNHYPQDIEWTVEQSHPAVRSGCCAAFSVESNAQEQLVIAAEIDHRFFTAQLERKISLSLNTRELVQAIRQAITEHHDLRADQVLLLKPASLPKTTSGKIQRYACRDRFISGTLEALNEVES